jgi:hypothetical protein
MAKASLHLARKEREISLVVTEKTRISDATRATSLISEAKEEIINHLINSEEMIKSNHCKWLSVNAFLSLMFCFMCMIPASAQKKQFTLDELLGGGESYWKLTPENIYTTWWGNIALRTTPDGVYDLITGKEVLTVEQVNKFLNEKFAVSGHNFVFPTPDEPIVMLTKGQRRIMLDFYTGRTLLDVTLPANSVARDFNVKSKQTAYTIAGNLYVFTPNADTLVISRDGSTDGSDNIVYGQSVHRDEFGIHGGTFWSPDGKMLAYYRMDQSMVPSYPQVDIKSNGAEEGESRIAETYSCHYPMAGENSHVVKVGVFNTETKENISLDTLMNTWMAKHEDCIFISSRQKTNIEELRKLMYTRVKQLHVQKYPYNNFLFEQYNHEGEAE